MELYLIERRLRLLPNPEPPRPSDCCPKLPPIPGMPPPRPSPPMLCRFPGIPPPIPPIMPPCIPPFGGKPDINIMDMSCALMPPKEPPNMGLYVGSFLLLPKSPPNLSPNPPSIPKPKRAGAAYAVQKRKLM